MRDNKLVIIIILIAVFAVILSAIGYVALSFNDTEYTVTIVEKELVNYFSEGDADSKYLIYCEDENGETLVFENTDNWLRGKWDSSDIYAKLKVGETYTVTVIGIRIPFFSMYQNIVNIS